MFNFEEYQKIKKNIDLSGKKTKIIAISKNHPLEEVKKAIMCGLEVFGENRVQEAKSKFENIKKTNTKIKLHLTGPLQTNKVKQALGLFDVFHTLDREKLLKELVKFPEVIKEKSFFVQINTGKEITKSGVFPEDTKNFLGLCKNYGLKNIDGLMCIPPINESPIKHYQMITDLTKELGLGRPSIGMSDDYLYALDFNPNYVRLGTVLFGKRQ
ncbi:YggS family pyridoxal phosphate-dependent enzyme [Alphaproteobacteria bacterium]|nr:YggS family pyridoxal phosphate-dependent enzyme [Alphaproteobacteria bacterium]